MLRGSCLCGNVSWESPAAPEQMGHCHCSMCRKFHGAAFASYLSAPAHGFRLRGEEHVARYESSPGNQRPFCSRCGSAVASGNPGVGRVFMPAGNLDEDPGARPELHLFAGSKAPWYRIADALAQFAEYPPEIPASAVERPALPQSEPGVIRGSCLCGDVAFEFAAERTEMRHCHCRRCRKARSAAHATNLFGDLSGFRWLRGEELAQAYKIPEADRFTNAFCRSCGSLLPRLSPERKIAVIPAGVIDGDPGARPRCHIFCGSKAPWYDLPDDGLPRYEEYPPDAG